MFGMGLLEALLIAIAALIVVLLPVKFAAIAMDADRTGFGWCLIALIVSTFLHGLGLTFPVFGSIIAFFFAAAGFAWILGTSYLGGIGISLLHIIFSAIIAFALSILGLGALTVYISKFF